jgi:hypothetical protein
VTILSFSSDFKSTLTYISIGVFKKIWLEGINVFCTFFVSLALFPGFTTLITSANVFLLIV